jgi:hypothetical protein
MRFVRTVVMFWTGSLGVSEPWLPALRTGLITSGVCSRFPLTLKITGWMIVEENDEI